IFEGALTVGHPILAIGCITQTGNRTVDKYPGAGVVALAATAASVKATGLAGCQGKDGKQQRQASRRAAKCIVGCHVLPHCSCNQRAGKIFPGPTRHRQKSGTHQVDTINEINPPLEQMTYLTSISTSPAIPAAPEKSPAHR